MYKYFIINILGYLFMIPVAFAHEPLPPVAIEPPLSIHQARGDIRDGRRTMDSMIQKKIMKFKNR